MKRHDPATCKKCQNPKTLVEVFEENPDDWSDD